MAYLVSGSSGFVGASLCKKLALSEEVYALYHETLPVIAPQSNIHLVPFARIDDLAGISDIDTVVHCAALHPNSLPESPDIEKYLQVNCLLTKKMAELANALSVKQFLYLSTIAVYGDVRTNCIDEETPFFAPNLYGASKYLGELIMNDVSTAARRLSLRLPGIVGGASRYPWLCRVKQKAMNNLPIVLYNPEALFNNVTDVDDIVRFIRQLSCCVDTECDVINFGASEPVTVLEAVTQVIECTGSKSSIELSDLANKSFCISTEKLTKKYDFIPVKTVDCISRYSTE